MTFQEFADRLDAAGYVLELERRDNYSAHYGGLAEEYPDLVDLRNEHLILWVLDPEVPGLVVDYWPRPDFNADWSAEGSEELLLELEGED